MFSSILIANRGEIACRIAKTAKRLGLRVIAVYSQADAAAKHVKMADDAYLLGPAPVTESYLRGDKVLAIAKQANADMIHPGYGFLSENAQFAQQCAEAGIYFVGPSPEAINAMGSKDHAKDLMQKAGVPVVPGYQGKNQDPAFLKQKAYEIGYPVMIKAVAGGGGKGMRKVAAHADFDDALISCTREAKASFGNDVVLIEKCIQKPRHIEMQIFGDQQGNVVHLFERDCSLQRRHQKVIEEAPAPGMTEEIRLIMGNAAVAAAKAVNYVGAGTVEFIVDGSGGLKNDGFYFMEMNTRLQVEHPVTEIITGYDLVEWQLKVAQGESLPASQTQITSQGHAFEARIYAEDPANQFLPQTGKLHRLKFANDKGIRIDSGIEQGDIISPFYDPMIAKIIVAGKTRKEALSGLADALGKTDIIGLRNNVGFLEKLARNPKFANAEMDTDFIDENLELLIPQASDEDTIAGLMAWYLQTAEIGRSNDPWRDMGGWSLAGTPRVDHCFVNLNGQEHSFKVVKTKDGYLVDDQHLIHVCQFDRDGEVAILDIDGIEVFANYVGLGSKTFVLTKNNHFEITAIDLLDREELASAGSAIIKAPMPGKVIALNVELGDEVEKGNTVLVLEAMKMEHNLTAGMDASVKEVRTAITMQVEEGDVLIVLEPEEADE